MNVIAQYLFNWLHLLDQAANTLIGGDPRETLSARMGRDIEAGRCVLCRHACAVLSLIQRDHCAKAWAKEQQRFQPDMQTTGD